MLLNTRLTHRLSLQQFFHQQQGSQKVLITTLFLRIYQTDPYHCGGKLDHIYFLGNIEQLVSQNLIVLTSDNIYGTLELENFILFFVDFLYVFLLVENN